MKKALGRLAAPLVIGAASGLAAGWYLHASGTLLRFINMITSCVTVVGDPPPPCADTSGFIPFFVCAGALCGLAGRLLCSGIRKLLNASSPPDQSHSA